ncbi:hypothetical protein NQ317_014073 [Molorchus minor]|uniref:PDZ domain-containing protein n=1 Tax=Molorchus minor TaxID=1323400 RepID=A0ABQ9JG94_9CUCU|nr:hypothetical protein NQ317_014073 [Molorchus minor]
MDDTALEPNEVKVVALRSHDFTGLGFNICGNMREGIYIKDILHRGPAFESGKLNAGDRINSVTISFEHMVYEDALTILSYASPYEVMIEAKGGKNLHSTSTPGQGGQPCHPIYRSSLKNHLKKRLFGEDYTGSGGSNYSSLQKSRSNMTTLERKESKSPAHTDHKKALSKHLSSEQLKTQLEQRISTDHQHNLRAKEKPQKIEAESQKTENKFQKFGIRVLPSEQQQKSPKSMEQNENNINIEKHQVPAVPVMGIDEVDESKKPAPVAVKRDKKSEEIFSKVENFERTSLQGSGIKRDKDEIPQEIPDHMFNAAIAARNNRKNSDDATKEDEDSKAHKKKGKAPSPPMEMKLKESAPKANLDEIQLLEDVPLSETHRLDESMEKMELDVPSNDEIKDYNSDSDIETDNQSSVNTIELNSSEITIHQSEEEERQNRRTASTGDLSKMQRTRKISTGTLERAQSLDITDTGIPSLNKKRKGGRIEDTFDMDSDEDIFGKALLNKEPRLSLILDGLNTFQRNRLKKSTEWGNLEDVILKLNPEDESITSLEESQSLGNIEPKAIAVTDIVKTENTVKNQIWPTFDDEPIQNSNGGAYIFQTDKGKKIEQEINERKWTEPTNNYEKRQQIPFVSERSYPPTATDETQKNKEIRPRSENNEIFIYNSDISNQFETKVARCVKIVPPIMSEKIVIVPEPEARVKENWDIAVSENIINTSPPLSLEAAELPEELLRIDDINKPSTTGLKRSEEVLSKIPLLNSMVKNQKEESMKKPVLSTNSTDETKTIVTYNTRPFEPNLTDVTQNFLYTERLNCNHDDYTYSAKPYDINVSDDIKVSRHSHGSLERQKSDVVPISDDAKSEDSSRQISNVNVTKVSNGDSELHSLELSINNEPSELYTTALDGTIVTDKDDDDRVTISTPDLIKNVTLPEAIASLNRDVTVRSPTTIEISKDLVGVTESKFSTLTEPSKSISVNADQSADIDGSKNSSTLTYITEIQVTPNNSASSNISEVEIIPNVSTEAGSRNLDSEFENYVKSFESKLERFENNIQDFDNNLEEFIKEEPKSIVINEKVDEKELHKIQEIAEEQLKKLPEMRFTTSSYESPKIPEKRHSIELLRIPIATTMKTPPTSPERRDSRNLDNENDKAILELMSSSVTSTPYTTSKYQIKPPSKNVTVTSIRSNSKIPSGLPTFSGSRPPIAPRKVESNNDNVVQVSTNGNYESSFKQWVFNPSNVTNVVVTESKQDKS